MRRVFFFLLLLAPLATSLQSSREAEAQDQDRNRRSNPNVRLQGNGGQGDARAKRSNQKEARLDFQSKVNEEQEKSDALLLTVKELEKDREDLQSKFDELKKEDEALLSTINKMKMQIGQVGPSPAMLKRQVVRLAETVNASHILNPKTMQLTAIEDCEDVRARGLPAGTYFLRPYARSVFCTAAGELMVLRRKEGDIMNFNVNWTEFQNDLLKVQLGDDFVGLKFLSNFARDKHVCLRLKTRGQLVLKRKIDVPGKRTIVFSLFSTPPHKKSLDCTLKLFTVPETNWYTVTIGGAGGGYANMSNYPPPGGRGARLRAEFFWRKGEVIGASAGCWGGVYGKDWAAGNGGDASWLVHRGKKILLTVAGGGGGGGGKSDTLPALPGMHGRSSPEGGDAWWLPQWSGFDSDSMLLKMDSKYRAKGWADLRDRLLFREFGSMRSGAAGGGVETGGGGGGGGFEGGIRDLRSGTFYSAGGGGGSFCNATEGRRCRVEAGGNGRPEGFVVIEKVSCS